MSLLMAVSTLDSDKIEIRVGMQRGETEGMKFESMLIVVRLAEGQSSQYSTTFLYIWSC